MADNRDRWRIPWKGFLITVFIFSCWIQRTSAQSAHVTVVPNLPYGTVGSNIALTVQEFSKKVLSYAWYRRTTEASINIAKYRDLRGPWSIHTRYKVLSNGSLLISNLTLNDTDFYIVEIVDYKGNIIKKGAQLTVYGPLSKPTINSTNMTPIENKDNVSLTCHSESQALTFWWLTPRGSPDGDRILLSPDNKTLTIYNVTREDQGQYECEIRNPVSVNKSDPFTLNIKRNGFLLPGWAITLIVVGVAVGVSLMVCCWFFRDTGSFCKPSHQPPSSALLPSLQPQGRKKYEQRQEEEERGPPFHAPRSVQPSPSPSLSTDDGHIGCLPETHLPSILKSWCRGPGRGGLGGHPLPDISLSSDPLLKAQSPGLPLTSAS